MAKLSVSLFGGFSVALDGRPITSFDSNKVRALLAYLVAEADREHSRDKLSALLWPDMSDQSARSNLRYALSSLRKTIGDAYTSHPVLCISKQAIKLDLNGNLESDVLTFSRQLAQSPLTMSNLEEAIRVYQGDFLDGFYPGSDSAFEEWIVLKREQFRRQALETLHRLAQAYEKSGDLEQALSASWRRVDLEPWSEESHRYLMLLLGLSGRRAAALSQYETCRRVLAEELNVEPSRETIKIYEQIRDGEIKPLHPASEFTAQLAGISPDTKSGTEAEPVSSSRKKQTTRWLKMIGAGLLVIFLFGAGLYYFTERSKANIPLVVSTKGEIIGPCLDQVLPQLCITNAQTGLMTRIETDLPIERFDSGFSWSPDGQQIVFSAVPKPAQKKNQNAKLYVIHRDGRDLYQLTTGDFNDVLPAWSPDGEWIAFHRNCTLWIIHPDGTAGTALSSSLCATEITWSPDGRWIAFLEVGMRDGSRPSTIRMYKRDGSDSRIVHTFNKQVRFAKVAWSPDGEQIFCLYNTGAEDKTVLLDAQGQSVLKEGIEIPLSWFEDFYPQWGK